MVRVVCVLLAVAACLTASSAFAYTGDKTSTSVWDLQVQQSPITLDANTIYVSGTGIRLSNTATSGVAGFYNTSAPFPTNWAVGSWNLDLPPGTGFKTEIRGVNSPADTTPWFEIRREGTTPLPDDRADHKGTRTNGIADDTLVLPSKYGTIEYQVTLYSNTVGVTPTLRLMSMCYADTTTKITYVELPAPGYTTSLPVPWRSQYWVPDIGDIICGPTSMSMAMAYNGCNLDTAVVAADCYDDYNDMYGNWPCIAQGAAKHGFKAYYSRASGNNQVIRDFVAQGVPVEIGMAYSHGQLTNAPIYSTTGHLVLCVGIASNGDWICNDPAGSTTFWDHVNYLKVQLGNVWYTRSATVIPCIPNSVYWRYPYYPYKSTDPVSTNKLGNMELFARAVDGQIYHMYQASINGSWGGWVNMGGTAASDPVAVTNRTGGNAVFARFTDGNLYYNWQNGNATSWSGWINLGGAIAGKPSVGKSPDGRMDVFCRMPDGSIEHKWENTSSGWQAWASLGGNYAGDPVIGLNWEGREEVFVRGTDSQLYHCWQRNDGTWSSWASLGGAIVGEPAIGKVSDGRIEVYCRFTDGTMRHNWQNTQSVGTAWSGWSAYSGTANANMASGRTPAFIQEIYSRDSSGGINRAYQAAIDGGWSAWESLGGSSLGAPIVGHNDDGRVQVFIFQSDGKLWSKWQQTLGGWSAWTSFGSAMFPENVPPVVSSASASPTLVAAGDSVAVTAHVTDNVSVAGVTAKSVEDQTPEVSLVNQGNGNYSGSVTARSGLGPHTIRVTATDPSGNVVTNSSGSYTTTRVYAVSNKAAWDAVTADACSNYLFAVYGKVTVVNSGQFIVDDGADLPVTVIAANHGLANGRHVRVRGILVNNGSEVHIDSALAFITPVD